MILKIPNAERAGAFLRELVRYCSGLELTVCAAAFFLAKRVAASFEGEGVEIDRELYQVTVRANGNTLTFRPIGNGSRIVASKPQAVLFITEMMPQDIMESVIAAVKA